ncbi:hypothetical protein IU459_36165 [Nocardia amamiensis]|uniref:Uncharacterized protein n=1 Tax=Nocardia amamiensis TaxID=404578 RepID=A0ABS0D291_9NOCA|nr:hypothetical protein [Nocardia amamiensis]MBF6302914.1 hypothetical protein [Nocardia amamiensis]
MQHWASHNTTLLIVCKVGFFIAAAMVTTRYPDIARRRAGVSDAELEALT